MPRSRIRKRRRRRPRPITLPVTFSPTRSQTHPDLERRLPKIRKPVRRVERAGARPGRSVRRPGGEGEVPPTAEREGRIVEGRVGCCRELHTHELGCKQAYLFAGGQRRGRGIHYPRFETVLAYAWAAEDEDPDCWFGGWSAHVGEGLVELPSRMMVLCRSKPWLMDRGQGKIGLSQGRSTARQHRSTALTGCHGLDGDQPVGAARLAA